MFLPTFRSGTDFHMCASCEACFGDCTNRTSQKGRISSFIFTERPIDVHKRTRDLYVEGLTVCLNKTIKK